MELQQLSRWRRDILLLAGGLAFLGLAALLDTVIVRARQPFNLLEVVSGQTAKVHGPLDEMIHDPQDLVYESKSEDLRLLFDHVGWGYFGGGYRWEGRLLVSPGVTSGQYNLIVRARSSPKILIIFEVIVHPNRDILKQESKSFFQRFLGISPTTVAWFQLAVTLVLLILAASLTRKLDRLIIRRGQAEVYKVVKAYDENLLAFGMGKAHGVRPAMELPLLDDQGRICGMVKVQEASARDAVGSVPPEVDVKLGYLVSLPRKAGS